jgi:hypothetical protein
MDTVTLGTRSPYRSIVDAATDSTNSSGAPIGGHFAPTGWATITLRSASRWLLGLATTVAWDPL